MISKVGFNYYGVQNQRPQNVSKCPSFKGANLEQARGLADLAIDELLAAEKGGWESRRVEILNTLATIAEKRLGKVLDDRGFRLVLNRLSDTRDGYSLPKRIFNAAKVFTKE